MCRRAQSKVIVGNEAVVSLVRACTFGAGPGVALFTQSPVPGREAIVSA